MSELEDRQLNTGLCLDKLSPDDTDFVIECDLKIGHFPGVLHSAWDTIPALNYFDGLVDINSLIGKV